MLDVETEIYKLLDKLKKNGEIDEFYKFNNQVLREYMHGTSKLDCDFLVNIMNTYEDSFSFFKKLNDFEKELIGTMLWGVLGG